MNKVGHEFYVIMLKRQDEEVYADLAKTTQHIYLLKEDAEKDLKNWSHHYHVVKMIAYLDYEQKNI